MSNHAIQLALTRFPWVLHVFFIGAFAYLGASTANLFTAQAIRPAIKTGRTTSGRLPKAAPNQQLSAEALARMMGMQLPEPLPDEEEAETAAAAEDKPVDLSGEPVRTNLHAQLLATIVANKPEWCIATLRDLNQNIDDVYMVGDAFMGAKLLSIEQLRIILLNEGRKEFLDLSPANAVMPLPKVAAKDDTPALDGKGIKKLDDKHYQIERSTVNNALANMNELAMSARIVPSFKNGQANGFKLFSIKPDSLYSQIGIQNGDVIQKINGLDINSPDKALEAYGKLKSANSLDLQVERNGTTITTHYGIQ